MTFKGATIFVKHALVFNEVSWKFYLICVFVVVGVAGLLGLPGYWGYWVTGVAGLAELT